jgi:23S rRNA (adenine2503-C2)-methyltransferase
MSAEHLLGLLPSDLAAYLRANRVDVRDAEARRVIAHVMAGRRGFPSSRPVPRKVEEAVERLTTRTPLEIVERATDPSDGFVKYLFRLHDGALAEAVRIPLEAPGKFTVCISSQAGCAMGCSFCATGRLGLIRNLEPWEIVAQWMTVRDEAPGTVTGALFQGQGEPLHNYAAVMQAASILAHPCGGRIAAKNITISTVGLVPQILRFARERQPYRLIVSLTSAIDERRRSLFEGVPLRLNLIDVNDARPDGYRRATDSELSSFRDELRPLGIPIVRRYSGGAAKHAACGMLASLRSSASPRETVPCLVIRER